MNKYEVGGIIKSTVKLNKTNTTGKSVLNIFVETIEKFTTKDGKHQSQKNIHNIKCWGKTAEIVADNYKKGDYIIVSGRNETERDKNSGKIITELIVRSVENIHRTN